MRKYFFYLALLLVGCGGGGDGFDGTGFGPSPVAHVPEISGFVLLPAAATFMEGDGALVVTAEIGFRDAGLDIQTLWIRMPDGTSLQLSESFDSETGDFTEAFAMKTDQVGKFVVEAWLVDEAGDSSVHQTADFHVLGDVEVSAGGIWQGTVSNEVTGLSFELNGAVAEDNSEGRFFINGETLFILSDISSAGGEMTATITASSRPDSEFVPGGFWAAGVMTGSIVERSRIEGEWFLDNGQTGTMKLEYDDIYERGSDIARLGGTWTSSWGLVFNIDALGEIFAQAENGCPYDGQVKIIDPDYNVYRVEITDHCMVYFVSGLGVLRDEADTDDAFFMMLGEGLFIADELLRQ